MIPAQLRTPGSYFLKVNRRLARLKWRAWRGYTGNESPSDRALNFQMWLQEHEGVMWAGIVITAASFVIPQAWYSWRITEHNMLNRAVTHSQMITQMLDEQASFVQTQTWQWRQLASVAVEGSDDHTRYQQLADARECELAAVCARALLHKTELDVIQALPLRQLSWQVSMPVDVLLVADSLVDFTAYTRRTFRSFASFLHDISPFSLFESPVPQPPHPESSDMTPRTPLIDSNIPQTSATSMCVPSAATEQTHEVLISRDSGPAHQRSALSRLWAWVWPFRRTCDEDGTAHESITSCARADSRESCVSDDAAQDDTHESGEKASKSRHTKWTAVRWWAGCSVEEALLEIDEKRRLAELVVGSECESGGRDLIEFLLSTYAEDAAEEALVDGVHRAGDALHDWLVEL